MVILDDADLPPFLNPDRPKLTVVSAYTGNLSWGPLAEANHRAYCERWGYPYVNRKDFTDDRPFPTQKLRFMLDLMNGPDAPEWVFWIDIDAVFIRPDRPIHPYCCPAFDMVAGWFDDHRPAGGAFFARNCPAMRTILQQAFDHPDSQKWHHYEENGLLAHFDRERTLLTNTRVFNAWPVHTHCYDPATSLIAHWLGDLSPECKHAILTDYCELARLRGL